MIIAKQKVIDYLRNDLDFMNNIKNLSASWHDEKNDYPQVTITQASNVVSSYSDNQPDFRLALIQIDIWSRGNPFFISRKIIKVLEANGYYHINEIEQNDEDINRVILEYRIEE